MTSTARSSQRRSNRSRRWSLSRAGQPFVRLSRHLADALAHQDVVIATGAGAVEAAENQLMLQRTQAAVIWLDVDVETS